MAVVEVVVVIAMTFVVCTHQPCRIVHMGQRTIEGSAG